MEESDIEMGNARQIVPTYIKNYKILKYVIWFFGIIILSFMLYLIIRSYQGISLFSENSDYNSPNYNPYTIPYNISKYSKLLYE